MIYLCSVITDKDTTKMNETISYSEKLKRGDYTKIAKMLEGKYARSTVESQLKGLRTLKDDVKAAADRYLQTMEALYKPESDKTLIKNNSHE